jgi:hypothetical protein
MRFGLPGLSWRLAIALELAATAAGCAHVPPHRRLPALSVDDPAFTAEALAGRCRAGVQVAILLDGIGSVGMPKSYERTIATTAPCTSPTPTSFPTA